MSADFMQTGWRETFAGVRVPTFTIDGMPAEWWDLPAGAVVQMLDGRRVIVSPRASRNTPTLKQD